MKNVLFVLTSHDELGNTGDKTGFWVEEFAAPYYLLTDKGVKVTLASPKGGQPPIDPKSSQPDAQTPASKRYFEDKETSAKSFLFNILILFIFTWKKASMSMFQVNSFR